MRGERRSPISNNNFNNLPFIKIDIIILQNFAWEPRIIVFLELTFIPRREFEIYKIEKKSFFYGSYRRRVDATKYLNIRILVAKCDQSAIHLNVFLISFGKQVILQGSEGVYHVGAEGRINVLRTEASHSRSFVRPIRQVADGLRLSLCQCVRELSLRRGKSLVEINVTSLLITTLSIKRANTQREVSACYNKEDTFT